MCHRGPYWFTGGHACAFQNCVGVLGLEQGDGSEFAVLFDLNSKDILCFSEIISKLTLGWTALDSSGQVTDVHSNIPNWLDLDSNSWTNDRMQQSVIKW